MSLTMKKDNIDQEAGAGGNQKDPGGRGEDLPVQAVLASTASHLKTNIYFVLVSMSTKLTCLFLFKLFLNPKVLIHFT